MPAKKTSSTKTATKSKTKKLSRFPGVKQFSVAMAVILVFTAIGTYTLRDTFALRLSPSLAGCVQLQPSLYKGVRGQDGCVAAVQGFYRSQYGASLAVDGDFGPVTELLTYKYQGMETYNYNPVPKNGKITKDNKTWTKLTLDCYRNAGKPSSICYQQYRY